MEGDKAKVYRSGINALFVSLIPPIYLIVSGIFFPPKDYNPLAQSVWQRILLSVLIGFIFGVFGIVMGGRAVTLANRQRMPVKIAVMAVLLGCIDVLPMILLGPHLAIF